MLAISLFKYFSKTVRAAALLLLIQGTADAGSESADFNRPPEKGAAGSLRTIGAYPEERGVGHTVTALPDGRIFVYGHRPSLTPIDTVVLDPRMRGGERNSVAPLMWDPQRHAWRKLDNPPQCEYSPYLHTATALSDGRILIAGGLCDAPRRHGENQPHEPYKALAIWNDQTQKWESAPSLTYDRIYHTATLLANGGVLFVGGEADTKTADKSEPVLDSVELFSDGKVSHVSALRVARARHTATRLADGAVLVIGGVGQSEKALTSVEIWDANTQTWQDGPPMKQARHSHSASLLTDGRVLVAGGINQDGKAIASVEIFDPRTNEWSSSAPMLVPLRRSEARALGNGDVLLIGVSDDVDYAFAPAMLWERATGDWRPAGHVLPNRLWSAKSYAMVAMPGKQDDVLVFDSGIVMQWSRSDQGAVPVSSYGPRNDYTSIPLNDGRILMAGGRLLDWAEIYDPKTGGFSLTGRMHRPRETPAALTLDDGKVIVASERNSSKTPVADKPNQLGFAELWEPATGRWIALTEIDFDGASTAMFENFGKLNDGRVMLVFLVEKGYRALIWDPRTRMVEARSINAAPRYGAAVGITPDGRVLLVSGMSLSDTGRGVGAPEVWDSRTNRIDILSRPSGLKGELAAALMLRSGNVLVMDRKAYKSDSPGGVVLWEAHSGTWRPLPSLPVTLYNERSLVELEDGSIATDAFLLRPGASAWATIPEPPQNHATVLQLQSGRRMALSALMPHVAMSDEATGQWQPKANYYLRRKSGQKPVLVELSDGRVMVAGNIDQQGWPNETTIQIWDPKPNAWTTAGKLSGVYPDRSEAVLLQSGQVLYLGMDRSNTLKCELGHPVDNIWTDCSATLPAKGGEIEFTLGTMSDGRAALLFGQSEAYAYSEKNKQWLRVESVSQLVRDNPGLIESKLPLPDGCSVSGLPLRLFGPQKDKELKAVPLTTGIRPDTARMITLSDGTVVVAGYPEGTAEIDSGFFHRKASCAGFEAQPGDDVFMPDVFWVAPKEAAPAAPSESKLKQLIKTVAAYKWIAVAVLVAAFLLYWALRTRVLQYNDGDVSVTLPKPFVLAGRVLVYALLALVLIMMLPTRCQFSPAPVTPKKTIFSSAPPCRFVGIWSSSRGGQNYRITLTDDGRYTTDPISTGTGSSRVQTGSWMVRDDKMVWYHDLDQNSAADINPISDESDNTFTLREEDGEYTRFKRLQKVESANCSK